MLTPRGTCVALLTLACLSAAWAGPPAEIEREAVRFPARDGHMIAAEYYPPAGDEPAPIVILLHMYNHDRSTWQPLIEPLHEAGFAILAIDLRGHGQSATTETHQQMLDRDTRLFEAMTDDVRGAYDWLAEQEHVDRSRFALVGASVGSSVALRYAKQDRSVDAIVCLSPGLNYLGLDSKRDIRQITGREMLLIAGRAERHAADAVEALDQTAAGVDTKLLDGDAHGTDLFETDKRLPKHIADYLKKAVGPPAREQVYGSIWGEVYHQPDAEWVDIIKPTNLRVYSSPQEAEARGLRASKTKGPLSERD